MTEEMQVMVPRYAFGRLCNRLHVRGYDNFCHSSPHLRAGPAFGSFPLISAKIRRICQMRYFIRNEEAADDVETPGTDHVVYYVQWVMLEQETMLKRSGSLTSAGS